MNDSLFDLIALLTTDIYLPENIFIGNQNDYTLPNHNNYIIFTEINTNSMGMPQTYYDQTLEMRHYNNLDNSSFQVDFYGNQARSTAANFRIALQSSFATDYLFTDKGYSISNVSDLNNLTMVMDQQVYVQRYIVKFNVLNNNYLQLPIPAYEQQDINLLYAGNTTGSIINN